MLDGRSAAWEIGFAFLLGDVTDALDDLTVDAAWFLAYAEIDLGDVASADAFVADLLAAFDAAGDDRGTAATLTLTAKLAYIRGDAARMVRDGERAAGRRLGGAPGRRPGRAAPAAAAFDEAFAVGVSGSWRW